MGVSEALIMFLRQGLTINFIRYQLKYWSMICEMRWSTSPKYPI